MLINAEPCCLRIVKPTNSSMVELLLPERVLQALLLFCILKHQPDSFPLNEPISQYSEPLPATRQQLHIAGAASGWLQLQTEHECPLHS